MLRQDYYGSGDQRFQTEVSGGLFLVRNQSGSSHTSFLVMQNGNLEYGERRFGFSTKHQSTKAPKHQSTKGFSGRKCTRSAPTATARLVLAAAGVGGAVVQAYPVG